MNGWNHAEAMPADFEPTPLPGPEAAIERAALPVAAGEMGPLPAAPWLAEPVRSDPRVRRTPAPAETPKRRWNRRSAREQARVRWNTPNGREEARGRVKRVVVKADPRVRWIPPAGLKEAPPGPLATPPEAPLFDVPGPYEVNVRDFGAIGSKLQFVGSIDGELDVLRIRVDKVRVRVEADSPPERPADSSDDPYLQERLGKPGHFDKPIHADQWVFRDAPAQVAAFRQLRPGAGIGIFGAAAKGVSHAAVIVAVDAAKLTVKFKPAAATTVTDADVWNDDRPPIQAALDEAGVVAGVKNLRGALVRVPAGTYPIGVPWAADNRPVFVWSNTRVVGEGPQRTVLVLADEVNQPVWDPQNPGNNLWAKVKSAGTAMVVANSRSTSWARDHRERFHEGLYFDDCTWLNVGGFGIKLGPSPGQLMRLLRVRRCRLAGQAVAIWLAAENHDSLIDDVEITDTFFCFTLKQACVIQTRGEPAFPGKWLYPTGGRGRLYRCRFYHCPTGGLREPSYSYDASHIHPVLSFVATRRLKGESPGRSWAVEECVFVMGKWYYEGIDPKGQNGAIELRAATLSTTTDLKAVANAFHGSMVDGNRGFAERAHLFIRSRPGSDWVDASKTSWGRDVDSNSEVL